MKVTTKRKYVIAWIFAYLALMDISINVLFKYPKNPGNISPSAVKQFFEYGRSTEGKLKRMTRRSRDESAPIASVGWLENPLNGVISKEGERSDHPVIRVVGMSHAGLLAGDMAKADSSLIIRNIGAPGAVPTWAYAAYLADLKKGHSDAVVLAVMTWGIPFISATSGATDHFDAVYPYTFPRFYFENGALKSVPPPFVSFQEYQECFFNPAKWKDYIEWLRKYDKYYDPLLFRRTFLDGSSLFRMLRRAYAYSTRRKKEAEVFNMKSGYNQESEEVRIFKAVILEFQAVAKKNDSIPIIYIVNDVNKGDYLFRLLEPILSSHKILYLSTHEICPPDDPRCFLPDSHFIPSKNMELARAMIKIIKDNIRPVH
jgi:hypothetical protein